MVSYIKIFCSKCGADMNESVQISKVLKSCCPSCGAIHYGLPEKIGRARACMSCNFLYDPKKWEPVPIEEWERVPSQDSCENCKSNDAQIGLALKEGGIFWRCAKCGNMGVLGPDHPLSKAARVESKIPISKAIGIDCTPEQCPVCNELDTRLLNE